MKPTYIKQKRKKESKLYTKILSYCNVLMSQDERNRHGQNLLDIIREHETVLIKIINKKEVRSFDE